MKSKNTVQGYLALAVALVAARAAAWPARSLRRALLHVRILLLQRTGAARAAKDRQIIFSTMSTWIRSTARKVTTSHDYSNHVQFN